MKVTHINSKENSLVKKIKKLQASAKQRYEDKLFVIEGLRLLSDAYDNGIHFKYLFFTEQAEEKHTLDIKKFAQNSDENYIVSQHLLEQMSDTKTPQGAMAVVAISDSTDFVLDKNGRYIALENLQNPSNIGAIARTAEALGVSGMLISSDSCDIYSPKVLRASMGTVLRVPFLVCDDLANYISKSGLKSYACVVDGYDCKIGSFSFENSCVCVIGNEGNGLTEKMRNVCDIKVTIPMSGRAESLNAASAASVVIWEMTKN